VVRTHSDSNTTAFSLQVKTGGDSDEDSLFDEDDDSEDDESDDGESSTVEWGADVALSASRTCVVLSIFHCGCPLISDAYLLLFPRC
jgi:hypothetical protein